MAGAEYVAWQTWNDLAAADPRHRPGDAVRFDLERAVSEMYWLTARDGWSELRAVRTAGFTSRTAISISIALGRD